MKTSQKQTSLKAMLIAVGGFSLLATLATAAIQPGTDAAAKPVAQPGAQPLPRPSIQPGVQPPVNGGAQPVAPVGPPPPPARSASSFKWTDPDLEKAGQMIAGTWKSTKDVPLVDGSGSTALVMSVAPVVISGVDNAMFSEIARADSLQAPFRTAIYQLYKHQGKIRLRTYELHRGTDGADKASKALAGMSYMPQWFPSDMNRDWLVGTLDLDLTVDANGLKGKTPYPYPTAVGGAVEMTSELTISKDSATTLDRGMDATGKVVWGDKDAAVTWARSAPLVTVKNMEDGLIVIEYAKGDGALKIDTSERIAAHYSGWVGRNLTAFDSSRGKPQPLVFNQGQLVKGWTNGLKGYGKGAVLRLFIPPALAWGERGRNAIPANADVIFEVEVVSVEAPPAPAVEGPAVKQPEPQPAEGEKKVEVK